MEALSVAKEMGLTTSIDLNYRAKLWQSGILPLAVIPNLVKYCDVVMGNIWAMEKILGIAIPSNNLVTKNDFLAAANEMSATLLSAYPQCKTVANTFRFTSNESIKYYATINTKFEIFNSIEFETNGCSDMSGSGDCFMAGLIYGMSNNMPPQAIIDFAASAAVGKLQEAGDSTKQSIEQIKTRLQYE